MASMTTPDPHDVQLLAQIVQLWSSGNQQTSIDTLRPHAEAGKPWSAALLSWLLTQQGHPAIREAISWAIRAAEWGLASQTVQTFNNAVGYISMDSEVAMRLPELLRWSFPWSGGVDLVGQGYNLAQQGQPELGLQIMQMATPLPVTNTEWQHAVEQAHQQLSVLHGHVSNAAAVQADLDTQVMSAKDAIDKAKRDLETSASQAGLLVTSVTSDATNSLFKADATRNSSESAKAWGAGLAVLGAAATVAVLPVLLHYFGAGPDYSAVEQLGIHLASTAALGTVAGVLLARARARDRSAQRANDLSTAMGTMISYSNQIADPSEKQRFMMMMGQLVLQSHLTSGPAPNSSEDSLSGLLAVANMIRPASGSNA